MSAWSAWAVYTASSSLIATLCRCIKEMMEHSEALHSRIAQYYLACLAADDNNGISLGVDSSDYSIPNTQSLADVLSEGLGSPGDRRQRFIGYLTFIGPSVSTHGGVRVEPILLFDVSDDGSVDRFPFINPAFMRRHAMGSDGDHIMDTLDLQKEIGLADPDTPLIIADAVRDLHKARPDWPWQESPDIEELSVPLVCEADFGIYNCAVICAVERSPYTRGLENELDALAGKSPHELAGTALEAWLNGVPRLTEIAPKVPSLWEPLPLNREQREAVQRALTEQLTVITGPPGTGKSQVVTSLLINAAVQGQRVLFASKNNKAVGVVEERLNGFGSHPVLLRLGSDDHRRRLAEHLDALRGGGVTADDTSAYERQTEHHMRLLELLSKQSQRLERTVELRNRTGRLERDVEEVRGTMAAEEFAVARGISPNEMDTLCAAGTAVQAALTRSDRSTAGAMARLFWPLVGPSRIDALRIVVEELCRALRVHALAELPPPDTQDLQTLAAHARAALLRLDAILKVHVYFSALAELQESPAPESIARETFDLRQRIIANSVDL